MQYNLSPAQQRSLFRAIVAHLESTRSTNFGTIASEIGSLQRTDFYRLRDGRLTAGKVNLIIQYAEKQLDLDVDFHLETQARFSALAHSAQSFFGGSDPKGIISDSQRAMPPLSLMTPYSENRITLPPSLKEKYDAALFPESHSFENFARSISIFLSGPEANGVSSVAMVSGAQLYGIDHANTYDGLRYEGVSLGLGNQKILLCRDCLTRSPKILQLRYLDLERVRESLELSFDLECDLYAQGQLSSEREPTRLAQFLMSPLQAPAFELPDGLREPTLQKLMRTKSEGFDKIGRLDREMIDFDSVGTFQSRLKSMISANSTFAALVPNFGSAWSEKSFHGVMIDMIYQNAFGLDGAIETWISEIMPRPELISQRSIAEISELLLDLRG